MTPRQRFGLRSLHGRLLWLVACVLLLAMAALGAYIVDSESRRSLDGIRLQARAAAQSVALASANPMLTEQFDQIEALLLRQVDFPGVLSVHLLDADGHILGHAVRGEQGATRLVFGRPGSRLVLPRYSGPLPQPQQEVLAAQGRLVAWHPVITGPLLGWARVEQSLAVLADLRHQVLVRTLAAGVLAVALSTTLLLWLLRAPMQLLDQARAFAEGLARVEGQQLAVPTGGALETVALGHALNDTSTRLNQQRETIVTALAQLRQQEALLRDSNLQLNSIFALSPDGLVSFDGSGRVRFANPAFFRLTGLEPGAVIGQPQAVLGALMGALCAESVDWAGLEPFFQSPAVAADAHHALRPLAAPGSRGHRLQLVVPRPQVLAVQGLQAAAADGEHAPAVSRLLYLRDVTRETEVDRLKSEFLATAAHELRTPIASIYGFAELLRMRAYPPERQQQMLERIHRNSAILIRIVNDLLDLSRLEAQQGADLQRAPADLAALVAQTVADHAPPPGRAGPQLLPAPGLPAACWALIDTVKLGRVLGNLLGNAYKYSPQGGSVRVQLLADATGGRAPRVGFEVADDGIGMSAEQVARVFERFYRADPSGTILGTGLGMSIVKDIVELHGGSVDVTSLPGAGTQVRVWLTGCRPPPAPVQDATVLAAPETALSTGA